MEGYLTFIGTGLSFLHNSGTWNHIVQNLPYGTHIAKFNWTNGGKKVIVDGVEVLASNNQVIENEEFTFHQPKRPPIPEHACVIADYMLMADFVVVGAEGAQTISKGVRRVSVSRDMFHDETDNGGFTFAMEVSGTSGWQLELADGSASSGTAMQSKLPAFGTNFVTRGYGHNRRDLYYTPSGGSSSSPSQSDSSTSNAHGQYNYLTSNVDLGINTFQSNAMNGTGGNLEGFEIVTPIHTSHHYKSFETPYLHELIGGDRNMEQTHLVCSADGKTWDEITRDTSYIGTNCLLTYTDTDHVWGTFVIMDEWRGSRTSGAAMDGYMNKDFAIAYDRVICLVDGFYEISVMSRYLSASDLMVYVGDTHPITATWTDGSDYGPAYQRVQVGLQRGQYIRVRGEFGHGGNTHDFFQITRVVK